MGNRLFTYMVIFFVCMITINSIVLVVKTQIVVNEMTGMAWGSSKFCIDRPTNWTNDCNPSHVCVIPGVPWENQSCQVNYTDPDGDVYLFYDGDNATFTPNGTNVSYPIDPRSLLNVTLDGHFTNKVSYASNETGIFHTFFYRYEPGCEVNTTQHVTINVTYDCGWAEGTCLGFEDFGDLICNDFVLNSTEDSEQGSNFTVYTEHNISCYFERHDNGSQSFRFDLYDHNATINGSDNHTLSDEMVLFNIIEIPFELVTNLSMIENYSYRFSVSNLTSYCEEWHFNFSIVKHPNRAPVFNRTISNQSWIINSDLVGSIDLDEHFYDPDVNLPDYHRDPLTYTSTIVPHIAVEIDSYGIVTFRPARDWYGTESVIFFAHDPYGLTNQSNVVYLTVYPDIEPPEDVEEDDSAQAPDGGFGQMITCVPRWYCYPWQECLPSGIQNRRCIDLNECNGSIFRPETERECTYIPSCNDGIKNGDEEGVDCGGLCASCPTCFDGYQNQDELAIDCGGPCMPCPLLIICNDGVKNGGEQGVDCGGPCPKACAKLEGPNVLVQMMSVSLVTKIIIVGFFALLVAILLVMLYMKEKKHLKKIKFKLPKLHLLKRIGHAKKTLLSRMKKPKVQLEEEQKETILDKLMNVEKKLSAESSKKILHMMDGVIKEYFKDLLEVAHQITNEELVDEINKKDMDEELKKILTSFFEQFSHLQYGTHHVSKLALQQLLFEARFLVIMTSPTEDNPPSFSPVDDFDADTESDMIYKSLMKAYLELLNNNLEKASSIYHMVHSRYEGLSEHEKRFFYPQMERLYLLLK